jgi:hypothetical protein
MNAIDEAGLEILTAKAAKSARIRKPERHFGAKRQAA